MVSVLRILLQNPRTSHLAFRIVRLVCERESNDVLFAIGPWAEVATCMLARGACFMGARDDLVAAVVPVPEMAAACAFETRLWIDGVQHWVWGGVMDLAAWRG